MWCLTCDQDIFPRETRNENQTQLNQQAIRGNKSAVEIGPDRTLVVLIHFS